MFVHVPKFEEAVKDLNAKTPEELQALKNGWNAALKSADFFMEDMESHNYGIAEALQTK